MDASAQGQGIGGQLLAFVLHLALRTAEEVGFIGVVDALPDAVAFSESLGFFRFEVVEGASDSRPALVALFPSIGEITRALP